MLGNDRHFLSYEKAKVVWGSSQISETQSSVLLLHHAEGVLVCTAPRRGWKEWCVCSFKQFRFVHQNQGGVFKKYWSPLPYLAEIQTQLVEGKALVLVSLFFQQMFPLLPIHPISEGWIPALGMHAHHRGEINTTQCGVCTQERWEAASHYQEGWACLLVPGITALLEWFCRLGAGKTETPYSGPSRAPCPGRERNFGHLRLFQCARCWSSARYWALILGLLARQSMMEFPGWLVVEESTYSLLFFFSFAYYCPECDPYLFVL